MDKGLGKFFVYHLNFLLILQTILYLHFQYFLSTVPTPPVELKPAIYFTFATFLTLSFAKPVVGTSEPVQPAAGTLVSPKPAGSGPKLVSLVPSAKYLINPNFLKFLSLLLIHLLYQ